MILKRIFTQVTKNIEKMIWQVEIQIVHKPTEQQYTISTWIDDPKAKVKIEGLWIALALVLIFSQLDIDQLQAYTFPKLWS